MLKDDRFKGRKKCCLQANESSPPLGVGLGALMPANCMTPVCNHQMRTIVVVPAMDF